MITRGKFLSFTMINWNGFFARTFELDQMVTTLSGGNGAGKSTSMAALITALIPDQTLLHFRNTTEAGSSSASRDRGLYGKLQRGHCYSMIDVRNSKGQRLWFTCIWNRWLTAIIKSISPHFACWMCRMSCSQWISCWKKWMRIKLRYVHSMNCVSRPQSSVLFGSSNSIR